MKLKFPLQSFVSVCFSLAFCGAAHQAFAASATTTLTIKSGSSVVTSVASGTVVTLTAMVKSGTTPLTVGTVNFCDASATYCTDIHQLATTAH